MTFEVLSDKNTKLKEFEQKFALELPGDYKSFLSKHNGISIEEGCISIKDIDEEVMMNVLFSSDRSLSRTLTLDYWNSEYGEDIPEKSALIGDFQDGSFLLLIMSLTTIATLIFWPTVLIILWNAWKNTTGKLKFSITSTDTKPYREDGKI